jgi:translation initiation factor IF-2
LDQGELARREEEARRQAELIRRQEEDLAEKRRQRQEAEQRERDAEVRAAAYQAAEQAKKSEVSALKEEAAAEAAASAEARALAQAEARAKADAESKARSDEDAARARDLDERRRKALAEAEAIRAMMAAPKKVLVAKKPEEPKPAEPGKEAIKGTIHKPTAKPGAPGATTTYSGLARRIERPLAVRAVAAAIGRNPISIIVPCHRVLGVGGALTGYAGGLDRKAALLQLESTA